MTWPEGIWKVAPLIDHYATARILPKVITFYHSANEQGWTCLLQTALPAIEKAVNFRKSTGCFKTVLGETLRDSFDADAEKLVSKFMNDSDPEVAAGAQDNSPLSREALEKLRSL